MTDEIRMVLRVRSIKDARRLFRRVPELADVEATRALEPDARRWLRAVATDDATHLAEVARSGPWGIGLLAALLLALPQLFDGWVDSSRQQLVVATVLLLGVVALGVIYTVAWRSRAHAWLPLLED